MLVDESRSRVSESQYPAVAATLRRLTPFVCLVAMALVATLDYGNGNIIGEAVADLHINAVAFLKSLAYTWDPKPFLGSHQGFTQVYLTPYTFLYALFAALHLSPVAAQRVVIFLIYLWIAGGMYWGLKYIAPGMNRVARLAGASAYLFNIYVAFNSAGSVPMLLTYGALPWMTGAIAAGLDGAMPWLMAGAATALFVFIGSGVNPPLIALNAILITVFIIAYFLWQGFSRDGLLRFAKTAAAAAGFSIALNLYWIVPFLDYIRTAWIGGVLDESPLMHNADSSYANVFRGLGQWAIFQTGPSGPYYAWAHAYQTGQLFSFLLWVVPVFGIAALLFRSRRSRALPFFLLVSFVSIPLAVGYYQGPIGNAITEPVYNLLYHYAPGFQMFRSAYKWVGGNEFGIAGLFAVFVWYAYDAVTRMRPAVAVAAVLLPLAIYMPVILDKANYAMAPLPPWTAAEASMTGSAQDTRTALFPSQYLEQFQWGDPGYYMEHALVGKPMVYGYLGAATNESSDQWLRLAYRRTREGDPHAAAIFRTLSVSELLQRDDFRAVQDFAFPDVSLTSDVTIAHDDLNRVLGLHETARAGANRLFPVSNPLPMVYGVSNPRVAPGPAVSVATSSDWNALARGQATISLDGLTAPQMRQVLASGATIAHSAAVIDDYTTTLLLPTSARVEAQYERQPFELPRGAAYRVSAMNLGTDYRYPLDAIRIDGRRLRPVGHETRSWQFLGTMQLAGGVHHVSAKGSGYVSPILILFTPASQWSGERAQVERIVAGAAGEIETLPVKQAKAIVDTERPGWYALSATPLHLSQPLYVSHPLPPPNPRYNANVVSAGRGVTQFELPYVPAAGVDPSTVQPLPQSWYESAAVFDWNRGSAVSWWLLSDDAHFMVYSAAKKPVSATLRMRFSALAPIDSLQVRTPMSDVSVPVNGATIASAVPEPLAADVNMPQVEEVPVRLRPGTNIVRIGCACAKIGLPAALVSDAVAQEQQRYIGAALSDLAIVTRDRSAASYDFASNRRLRNVAIPGGTLAIAADRKAPFAVSPLPLDDRTLAGDPALQGSMNQIAGRPVRAWIAETIALQGESYYRVFPIQDPSNINVALAETLPNTSSDRDARITSLSLVVTPDPANDAAGTAPVFALVGLRDMRTGATASGQDRLALSVDGRPAGSRVYLSRGRHTIASLTPDTGIDTITLAQGSNPQSTRVPLDVRYVSPVRATVTLPAAEKPFLLVLNESYYKEWTARVGDRQLVHVQTNGFANGWIVPPSAKGTTIDLYFTAQRKFIIAVLISAISALAILSVLSIGSFVRARNAA